MVDVLPDSRLHDPKATVMADWPCLQPDGTLTTVRLELEPIYCLSCGKSAGYVPRDVMSFVSWLCQPCSEKYGEAAALWQSSDQQFWAKVAEAMQERFGRALTQRELWELGEQDRLGRGLELLTRESPY